MVELAICSIRAGVWPQWPSSEISVGKGFSRIKNMGTDLSAFRGKVA